MPLEVSYVAEFRRRIQDVRASRRGLSFGIKDTDVSSAIAEITRGHLIVTIAGGLAPSLDFHLTDPRYDTIKGLYNALSRARGYTANLDEDANGDHPSIDLEPFAPIDIKVTGAVLVHHVFSDGELTDIITDAIRRHNPSLNIQTLPPQEWAFVAPLAHANVCRIGAYDSSKRRGLDKDVASLLSLADSFEKQYETDTTRLARAIQSPREANSNVVDEGDVMLGSMYRQSMRTGYMSPMSQVIPPNATVLLEPDERDVEDDNARINWQRNRNVDFHSYELWMDLTPEVVRGREGGPIFQAQLTTDDPRRDGAIRPTSSVQVFRSYGANATMGRSTFSTFVEEMGQSIRSFSVGHLESESTYYFRLYAINLNYIASSSNVVKVTTKTLRARFASTIPFTNKTSGASGTIVTLTLDTTKGAFTAAHTLRIGEKVVAVTILSSYSIQFTVPAFQNLGHKDLVITSPTKLVDVRSSAFQVTA